MLPAELTDLAARVLQAAEGRGERLATAESCTGGLVAAALTAIPGSSSVVERGFVTYSNEAKAEMLGVPPRLIAAHGAVSREVAEAMAEGAVAHSRADRAVSITGVAGPGGRSAEKPVGLVHFAVARRNGPPAHLRRVFEGDRDAIRLQAALTALGLLLPPPGT